MPYDAPIESLDIREPMTREAAMEVLSEHTRQEIDHWLAKYPVERRRSAVLAALREAQHQNQGYLTPELMDAVAVYLDLPAIYVYEAASFYSMFENRAGGPPQRLGVHEYLVHAVWRRRHRGAHRKQARHQDRRIHRRRPDLPQARRRMPGGLLWRADDDGRPRVLRESHPQRVDEILDALE